MSDVQTGYVFRRFEVFPDRRELRADGGSIRIGRRAFDVLVALLEFPGLIVPKAQLLRRVWGKNHIEESSVEAQIHALRTALGEDRDVVITLPGRGYRLDAEVRPLADPKAQRATNLPTPISSFVGREAEKDRLMELAAVNRLVTVTGSGGIGKTRLAIEAARALMPRFGDGVHLVELARVVEPGSMVGAVAGALDGPGRSRRPQSLLAGFGSEQLLLVLDNCEHLVEDVAPLVEALLRSSPNLHILATSQEALGVEGECLYRLHPLALPEASDPGALESEAVRLFADRYRSATGGLDLDPSAFELAVVACRRLEGVPLAIELAAARAGAFGMVELIGRLDTPLAFLAQGRRTAPARHQSLQAILDWSHALLSDEERIVFRRLSAFRGDFGLDAACFVADLGEHAAQGALAGLVAKCLVVSDPVAGERRFSLLETTRLYAEEKLTQASEHQRSARRHATFYRDLLTQAGEPWERVGTDDWLAIYAAETDQIRAALDWAISAEGDLRAAVDLTVAAIPLLARLSLFNDIERYAHQALAAGVALPPDQRLILLTALGSALVPTRARAAEKVKVCEQALDLARALGEQEYESRILLFLHRAHCWDASVSQAYARAFLDLARGRNHHTDVLLGGAMVGNFALRSGALDAAIALIEPFAQTAPDASGDLRVLRFGSDNRIIAVSNYALLLWLKGRHEDAIRTMRQAVAEASRSDQVVSLFCSLANGVVISRFGDDLAAATHYADLLVSLAERHALGFGRVDAQLLKASLALPTIASLDAMAVALEDGDLWIGRLAPLYRGWLAQGLHETGRVAEAVDAIEAALSQAAATDPWCLPELLKIRAAIVPSDDIEDAERLLTCRLAANDILPPGRDFPSRDCVAPL